jgi:hypothetical protein
VHTIYLLISIGDKPRKVPAWLDGDFLYRVNYGPATSQDTAQLYKFVWWDKSDYPRSTVTLLDRRVAEKLHDALFSPSLCYRPFLTDWHPTDELRTPSVDSVSPFDYDTASLETYPLIWTEDMAAHIMARSYSPSILGKFAKAPMAAIVLDIIDLVTYLRSIPTTESKSVATWLTEFLDCHRLRSIPKTKDLDVNWAVKGYLADMFTIVTCFANVYSDWLRRGLNEPWNGGFFNELNKTRSSWVHVKKFPGPHLFLADPPIESITHGSLDDLNAGFICSGPFKFKLTKNINEHLQLSNQREICLYWENPAGPADNLFEEYRKPWCLNMHRTHNLERSDTSRMRLML